MKDIIDTIEVMHERDLKNLLEEFGKYNDFKNNKLLCRFCKNSISMNNIYGILITESDIEFFCDDEFCYKKYLIETGEN